MGKVFGVIIFIILLLGLSYLFATGVAWIFIWAFNLEYSAWVMGLPMWVILVLFRRGKDRKETLQERWNRW